MNHPPRIVSLENREGNRAFAEIQGTDEARLIAIQLMTSADATRAFSGKKYKELMTQLGLKPCRSKRDNVLKIKEFFNHE